MALPVALTVSASDPVGATGVPADLKTFGANGVYGTSVLSAVTAQDTLTLTALHDVPFPVFRAQLEGILADLPPSAVKVGWLSTVPALRLAARLLRGVPARVVDPVLATRDGAPILRPAALQALVTDLLPGSSLLVVGPPGAAALAGLPVGTAREAKTAAMKLTCYGVRAVLVTGALSEGGGRVDGLLDGRTWHRFEHAPWASPPTAGKRGTLSAAITAWLARGDTLPEAVQKGLDYLRRAVERSPGLGAGSGPLGHGDAARPGGAP